MKIGFIDYYIDEWHANNYPQWLKEASGGEIEVAYAWAKTDSPKGGLTTARWCEKFGVEQCASIEELIEKSDGIVVLSPDNCEFHEELCQLPLRSGKPCYVDKTFAPTRAAAERIFAIAEESGTPCWSTSALRYAAEYKDAGKDLLAASFWGPNDFEIYSIHQLEPLMMLMGVPARRVMAMTAEGWYQLTVEFTDGRTGSIAGYVHGAPFLCNLHCRGESRLIEAKSDFFHEFILALAEFYRTGKEPVPHAETLAIMAVREAGLKALEQPGQWVEV